MKILTTPAWIDALAVIPVLSPVHVSSTSAFHGIRLESESRLQEDCLGSPGHVLPVTLPPVSRPAPQGLTRKEKAGSGGEVDLCNRCGACAKACPVDAIYLDNTGTPLCASTVPLRLFLSPFMPGNGTLRVSKQKNMTGRYNHDSLRL